MRANDRVRWICLFGWMFLTAVSASSMAFVSPKHQENRFHTFSTSKCQQQQQLQYPSFSSSLSSSSSNEEEITRLTSIANNLNQALSKCTPDYIKTAKVQVGVSTQSSRRLGLFTTENVNKNQVVLAIPYSDGPDQLILTPDLATKVVYKDLLPDGYDGWTGDAGLLSMLLLNEFARAASDDDNELGISLPKRNLDAQELITKWVQSLPTPNEMKKHHPLLWEEEDQEVAQSSSTKKIYRTLDDVEDDVSWLEERVWSADRSKFPEQITLNDGVGGETTMELFTTKGFKYALALVNSRSYYVDGALRLIPILDFANHQDLSTDEVCGGTMGTFGTTKGVVIRSSSVKSYNPKEEFFISYGPKSAADYLLEHGFVPPKCVNTCVSELTFDVDTASGKDRFADDKLDILEFETYDSAPMDPTQTFDVVSEVGVQDGEPDLAMMQFLRLVKLGGKDAFLLESIFRKEVWEFMSEPVSERNEGSVVDTVVDACTKALKEMDELEESSQEEENEEAEEDTPKSLCAKVRNAERKALTRTLEYMQREKEALDLKEYYQERRLKNLGLDSDWNEDDEHSDVGWGQTRAPGGADYDW
uniref:Rubisco LSMT substrate-binding domain-containing protein n=1 Tax=Ditylum brightwellii TaxID=49249 RepID=A0A7S4T3Q7_9STRA